MSYSRYAVFDPKSKGGVGASIATLALATGLRATGEGSFAVRLVDADGFNATLTQRMGQRDEAGNLLTEQDPALGVTKADLFEEDGMRPLFRAVESDARYVVVDTPAGSVTRFRDLGGGLTGRGLIEYMRSCGREPIVLLPFNPTIAAIRGVGEAIHEFGTDVRYVGLRMRLGFKPDDYRLWNSEGLVDRYGRPIGNRVRAQFEAVGGRLLDMPAAAVGSFAVAEALKLTIAEATRYIGPGFEGYDGLNFRNWLSACAKEFAKIGDWLGLDFASWKPF